VVTVDETGAEQIASDRRFVWDGHTVLHELPSDGDPITWYWEPGTFTPVAREQAGRLLSVASDHLGTPTEMYDETGAPTWQMRLDVLGSPTFDLGSPDDCPWRWPGQYEDEETGLYYNRNRYYEPTFGGYTSIDPIGLDGGMSLLAYVPDPILWTDPLGLARKCGRSSGGLVPNPYGRLGSPAHRAKVLEVVSDILERGLVPEMEVAVRTFGGQRSIRFMDVVARDPVSGRIVEVHQVGRTLGSNAQIPVSRERIAFRDIRRNPEMRGASRVFHRY
jgi:RHS repeat-associated protein